MNRLLTASAVALIVALSGATAQAENPAPAARPECIVDIDVNDEVWLRDHKMTEADVNELVAKLKQNGCQTLLIRCGCIGILPYRTKLSYPAGFDPQHARANPIPDIIKDMEAEIVQETKWMQRYADVIADFDPPTAFIEAGHKQGMKVIAWLDIFDDGWAGFHSKFIDEHPHCQWVGKDGKTYFQGLIDYSWPEAREFRVAQARELLGAEPTASTARPAPIAGTCPMSTRSTFTVTVSRRSTRSRRNMASTFARPKRLTKLPGTI